jgi:hypothetical protein
MFATLYTLLMLDSAPALSDTLPLKSIPFFSLEIAAAQSALPSLG